MVAIYIFDLCSVVWFGLASIMAYRVANTGKLMPAGVVLAISIVQAAWNGYVLLV